MASIVLIAGVGMLVAVLAGILIAPVEIRSIPDDDAGWGSGAPFLSDRAGWVD